MPSVGGGWKSGGGGGGGGLVSRFNNLAPGQKSLVLSALRSIRGRGRGVSWSDAETVQRWREIAGLGFFDVSFGASSVTVRPNPTTTQLDGLRGQLRG